MWTGKPQSDRRANQRPPQSQPRNLRQPARTRLQRRFQQYYHDNDDETRLLGYHNRGFGDDDDDDNHANEISLNDDHYN